MGDPQSRQVVNPKSWCTRRGAKAADYSRNCLGYPVRVHPTVVLWKITSQPAKDIVFCLTYQRLTMIHRCGRQDCMKPPDTQSYAVICSHMQSCKKKHYIYNYIKILYIIHMEHHLSRNIYIYTPLYTP